jgi:hypothetical protein
MPHSSENALFFRSPEWKATRARILARAGNCCECIGECGDCHETADETGDVFVCGIPNGAIIVRDAYSQWALHRCNGNCLAMPCADSEPAGSKVVRVVLTIAHLDHDTGPVPDDRLRAMCQRCHLRYDRHQHSSNGRKTRDRKRGQASLNLGGEP